MACRLPACAIYTAAVPDNRPSTWSHANLAGPLPDSSPLSHTTAQAVCATITLAQSGCAAPWPMAARSVPAVGLPALHFSPGPQLMLVVAVAIQTAEACIRHGSLLFVQCSGPSLAGAAARDVHLLQIVLAACRCRPPLRTFPVRGHGGVQSKQRNRTPAALQLVHSASPSPILAVSRPSPRLRPRRRDTLDMFHCTRSRWGQPAWPSLDLMCSRCWRPID